MMIARPAGCRLEAQQIASQRSVELGQKGLVSRVDRRHRRVVLFPERDDEHHLAVRLTLGKAGDQRIQRVRDRRRLPGPHLALDDVPRVSQDARLRRRLERQWIRSGTGECGPDVRLRVTRPSAVALTDAPQGPERDRCHRGHRALLE